MVLEKKVTAEFLIDPNTYSMVVRNRETKEVFHLEYGLAEVKRFESREKIALWNAVHLIECERGYS